MFLPRAQNRASYLRIVRCENGFDGALLFRLDQFATWRVILKSLELLSILQANYSYKMPPLALKRCH